MVVLDAKGFDVVVHAQATSVLGIIPREIDTRKFRSCPVHCNFVGLLESGDEMFCMLFILILNAKVINNEDEDNRWPLVSPQSRCYGALLVFVCDKPFGEEVISKASCLFETIDSLVYFEVHLTAMGEDGEAVLVNEFLRNVTDF